MGFNEIVPSLRYGPMKQSSQFIERAEMKTIYSLIGSSKKYLCTS